MTDQELYRLIGKRLKARRRMLELTQADVARAAGTTFQQIHKHEAGACAMSVARLLKLSAALRAPIDYFIDPMTERPMAEARSGTHSS